MNNFNETNFNNSAASVKNDPHFGVSEVISHLDYQDGLALTAQVRDLKPFPIDEPVELGGRSLGANPVEYLVSAAGACLTIGFLIRASQKGIKIEKLSTDVKANLDMGVFFGTVLGGRHGIGDVTFVIHIKADADLKDLEELVEASRTTSPVLNSLNVHTKVIVKVG